MKEILEKIEKSFNLLNTARAIESEEELIESVQYFFENIEQHSSAFLGYLEKKYPSTYEECMSRANTGRICKECGSIVLSTENDSTYECVKCGEIACDDTEVKEEVASEFSDCEFSRIIVEMIKNS